jgi:hypothetical protein
LTSLTGTPAARDERTVRLRVRFVICLDHSVAQVCGVASIRRKPKPTTRAMAEYLTAAQIAELLRVSE